MHYIEIDIAIPDGFPDGREIAVALLSDDGLDTFLETDKGLVTFVRSDGFSRALLARNRLFDINGDFRFRFRTRKVPDVNWNEIWEKSFNPVIVGEDVVVRAPFHKTNGSYRYEIIIEPKMAFGTGHHETTELMMWLMLKNDFRGKRVTDLGCGTGILAILASLMGASSVTAIDNDPLAVGNCLENLKTNNVNNVDVVPGDAAYLTDRKESFDTILANINRNTLIAEMSTMAGALRTGGVILLSGFYNSDKEVIANSASGAGLKLVQFIEKNSWVAMMFAKL
ncbi:MAG: 50S ribosomal protein L11 methyltransferase [Bacteroidetes bacterium]|nr:50S ribosomal protein L11 methyltransferase [Bacteroidota bacterium]